MSEAVQSSDAPHREDIAKLAKLIEGIKVCMVTTTTADGQMMSRPMAVQEVEFDGDLWFFTKNSARKVEQIRREPRVNVALASRSSWVSLTGTAEIVEDVAKAKELWNTGISAWFPDGPEDPDLVLVRVHADGAEYWDSPGAVIVSAISFVKSRLTGKPYHIEDRKVAL